MKYAVTAKLKIYKLTKGWAVAVQSYDTPPQEHQHRNRHHHPHANKGMECPGSLTARQKAREMLQQALERHLDLYNADR